MATIKDLTEEQFQVLMNEYFAPPTHRSKMTDEEIKDLAQKLNEKIKVPIISEAREEKIFIKIVVKIDRFLYDNLPNEFYDLIRSFKNGIDDEEAKRLIKRLARLANNRIDIPYIPESIEHIVIRFVIGVIINAARRQWDFAKANKNALAMNIPRAENPTDQELENIIS